MECILVIYSSISSKIDLVLSEEDFTKAKGVLEMKYAH